MSPEAYSVVPVKANLGAALRRSEASVAYIPNPLLFALTKYWDASSFPKWRKWCALQLPQHVLSSLSSLIEANNFQHCNHLLQNYNVSQLWTFNNHQWCATEQIIRMVNVAFVTNARHNWWRIRFSSPSVTLFLTRPTDRTWSWSSRLSTSDVKWTWTWTSSEM